MVYRCTLRSNNKYDDNGWYSKTGDTIVHYFTKKSVLCGTRKFDSPHINLAFKISYDRRCKRCIVIRRKHLNDRMRDVFSIPYPPLSDLLRPKSHSPRKPK